MSEFLDSCDVVVVGGGHAGVEASLACARMGLKTILITLSIDNIARMSCNPSIGGIAKGNIVREIDALGGQMARLIDASMIQFRMLNSSRGPAVAAPRSQADKILYSQLARAAVEHEPNLRTLMDEAVGLGTVDIDTPSIKRKKLVSVKTARGRVIKTHAAILTTGTFLGGRIFIGAWDDECGRLGEKSAKGGLTASLQSLGFVTGRLKTGTPPRVIKRTIDFDALEKALGDEVIVPFSFDNKAQDTYCYNGQTPCHIAYTNGETHKIIRENIGSSPLYSGKIVGTGPRYCPSIEDKVMRFPDRERHQIFIEPESLLCQEIYLNGLSSSLPESVQISFMRTMRGFENAIQARPGYAVEYDYVDPTQLYPSLETKLVAGLFLAGQINGTSGYEEAAGQGIIAGINAGLYSKSDIKAGSEERAIAQYDPVILRRDEAYIGVLIDDLVTKGTKEPYRMFTARAEYRLCLRHDNADNRLAPYAQKAGLKTQSQIDAISEKYDKIAALAARLERDGVNLTQESSKIVLPSYLDEYPADIARQALVDAKYRYYIEKQEKRVQKMHKMEAVKIPSDFDYDAVKSLSAESKAKLKAIRPVTLSQASRISGIRVSDVMLLMVYLRKG